MTFHVQANINQMHSQLRKRVTTFERCIQLAKREQEAEVNWKDTYGGIGEKEKELGEEEDISNKEVSPLQNSSISTLPPPSWSSS